MHQNSNRSIHSHSKSVIGLNNLNRASNMNASGLLLPQLSSTRSRQNSNYSSLLTGKSKNHKKSFFVYKEENCPELHFTIDTEKSQVCRNPDIDTEFSSFTTKRIEGYQERIAGIQEIDKIDLKLPGLKRRLKAIPTIDEVLNLKKEIVLVPNKSVKIEF